MNLPSTACPVTYCALRTYTRMHDDDGPLGLPDYDHFEEVKREAKVCDPSPETVRLRAFFALELIYTETLPKVYFAASIEDIQKFLQEIRTPRTVEGLQTLKSRLEQAKKKSAARAALIKLRGDKNPMSGAMMTNPLVMLDRLVELCDVLTGCLRRDDLKGMTLIGDFLGHSFYEMNEVSMELELIARVLLSINSKNPLHPWEREE